MGHSPMSFVSLSCAKATPADRPKLEALVAKVSPSARAEPGPGGGSVGMSRTSSCSTLLCDDEGWPVVVSDDILRELASWEERVCAGKEVSRTGRACFILYSTLYIKYCQEKTISSPGNFGVPMSPAAGNDPSKTFFGTTRDDDEVLQSILNDMPAKARKATLAGPSGEQAPAKKAKGPKGAALETPAKDTSASRMGNAKTTPKKDSKPPRRAADTTATPTKGPPQLGDAYMSRHHVFSRAYHRAASSAKRQGLSPELVKASAREAGRAAVAGM